MSELKSFGGPAPPVAGPPAVPRVERINKLPVAIS